MGNDGPAGTLQPPPSAVPAPQLFPPPGRPSALYPPESFPSRALGPEAPDVPSRAPTVLVTTFFGPFGLIPAYLHGRAAERRGVSASRYWTAFGVSMAFFVMLYTAGMGVVFTLAAEPISSGATVTSVAEAPAPPAPDIAGVPAGPVWTAASLVPVLDGFADDDAAFSGAGAVTVPCGGEGAHGVSPALVERLAGGGQYRASAQILPDAGSAEQELLRLQGLVAGCGAHDAVPGGGAAATRCAAPVIDALAPVVRYEQECEADPLTAVAIVRSGNAVVGLSAPSSAELDAALPGVLAGLQLD
jgi:hypothetical protein